MKLQSKQREGKKVRCVYDPAKTPLQRLLQSGVLPAEMQQELLEVAHALDPIRLFEQLEQLQQAVFHCAVSCSPFVSSIPSTPIRVFSVECCMMGTLSGRGSVPIRPQGSRPYTGSRSGENGSWAGGKLTRTPLPESGSRSCPGWLPILNGAAATSSGSCGVAPQDAFTPCKSGRSNAAYGKYGHTSWKRARSNGKLK